MRSLTPKRNYIYEFSNPARFARLELGFLEWTCHRPSNIVASSYVITAHFGGATDSSLPKSSLAVAAAARRRGHEEPGGKKRSRKRRSLHKLKHKWHGLGLERQGTKKAVAYRLCPHVSNTLRGPQNLAKRAYAVEVCWIAGSSRTGKLTELAMKHALCASWWRRSAS